MIEEKEQKKVSLRLKKGTEKNPFIFDLNGKMFLQPRTNTVIAKGQEIVDTSTGEVVQEDVIMGRRKIVDKSNFAKIYASEIGILFKLSKTAINVFLYLSKVMDYENKSIFSYSIEYGKLGYKTHKQVLKGLLELMKENIIAPHIHKNIYWLNPVVICKGERFAKYTEYVTEDFAKKQGNAMLKNQGGKVLDSLDPKVKEKYNLASNKGYSYQNNLFGGVDKIDRNTGEIIEGNVKK